MSKPDFVENAYHKELAFRGLRSVEIDFFTPPPPPHISSTTCFFFLIILVVTVSCDNKFFSLGKLLCKDLEKFYCCGDQYRNQLQGNFFREANSTQNLGPTKNVLIQEHKKDVTGI